MNPHETERHEETLPDLLAGDGDPRPIFESSALARCPSCRALFEELEELHASLDEVGRDQREALIAANTAGDASAEEKVDDLLRARMAARPEPARARPGSPHRSWPVVLLAAALILVAVTVILTSLPDTGPPYDPGTTLGEGVELVHPDGGVKSYLPFRWTGKLPEGGHFRIMVYDDADETAAPLESGPWTDKTWSPDPGTRGWPRRIRWEVKSFDAAGELRDAKTGWASLQP